MKVIKLESSGLLGNTLYVLVLLKEWCHLNVYPKFAAIEKSQLDPFLSVGSCPTQELII